ncbi:MAG: MFS transporter [Devosia sp.]
MHPAVYALALAAFSVGTAEFIIAGLLPQLSTDLAVTIPTAGLLVTGYAVGVAVGSPIIAALTARVPRRTMLLGVLAVFIIGQVLCAIAPNYAALLAGRLLVSFAHGVFFGVSLIIIGALVPIERQGRAFGLLFSGLTLATILGVPGGTAIGTTFGWRTSFWFVGSLSALATAAVAFLVPRQGADGEGHTAFGPQMRQLAKQEIYLSYLLIAFNALGFFAYLTYQVPLLLDVTHIDPAQVPIYLFIAGIGTVCGTFFSGRLTGDRLMPSLVVVMLLQAAVFLGLRLVAHSAIGVGIAMVLAGMAFGTFATPIQARIVAAAREAPTMASTLISTAFNVGIAAGAFVGASLLRAGVGYDQLPLIGVGCSVLAAIVGLVSWRLERRTVLAAA